MTLEPALLVFPGLMLGTITRSEASLRLRYGIEGRDDITILDFAGPAAAAAGYLRDLDCRAKRVHFRDASSSHSAHGS